AWKAGALPLSYTRLVRQNPPDPRLFEESTPAIYNWWRGKDSNLRRLSQQIYSLPPLTAREPLRTKPGIILKFRFRVKYLARRQGATGWRRNSVSDDSHSAHRVR